MSPYARELARRRGELVARCEVQRRQIADAAQSLKPGSHVADRALGIARFVRAHPLVVGVVAAAAMISGRGRMLRWIGIVLPIVSFWLRAVRVLRKI